MTENEFYFRALASIAGNSAFGSGRGGYVDYYSWAKRINEAALALIRVAENNGWEFDEEEKPP